MSTPIAADGPELQEIVTNGLGLPGVNSEVKLKLFDPWPEDSLPPTTSSLLAVASRKGLLAAAGPTDLIVTSTDSIRFRLLEYFDKEKEKSPVRSYEGSLRIPRQRLAHVAFTADEGVLVVSPQDGGGLDAYSVPDLEKALPAVSISTGGKALRWMVPNPAPEPDLAPLVALVTVDGELLLADLQNGNLRQGQNGSLLRSGVSCVSWSNKGKQLVAGLADGTAVQLKPDGQEMAAIPKPATLDGDYYVSSISWLQNDSFLFVYVCPNTEYPPAPCEYYMVERAPNPLSYTFKKLPEPLALMGKERLPTSHFIIRLRNFPPSLTELLLFAATSSADVGLVTKSGKALSPDTQVVDEFATTLIEEDNRRAVLPLSDSGIEDTSPVGMVLDCSSKELVRSPVPSNSDIDESSHSVPQLLILNNDGLLCSWWVIYNDSVVQKTQYPGMQSGLESTPNPPRQDTQTQSISKQQTQPATSFATPSSTFGQPAFGAPSTTSKTSAPAFGAASSIGGSSVGAFGTGGSSFGKPSAIGGAKSSWTSTGFGNASTPQTANANFGQPAFGSASSLGTGTTSFGAASPLGKPAFGQPSTVPAFGSSGFGTKTSGFGTATTTASPFGTAGASTQSGFAAFAQSGSFATQTSKDHEKPVSPFGKAPSGGFGGFGGFSSTAGGEGAKSASSFGQGASSGFGGFGQSSKDGGSGKPSSSFTSGHPGGFGISETQPSGSIFGKPESFKLQSTFKADDVSKDEASKHTEADSGFGFGSGLGDMLGNQQTATSPTHDKEESMSDDIEKPDQDTFSGFSPENQKETQQHLVTPPSTIGQPKATPAPPVTSLFGKPSQQTTTPQPPPPPASTGWSFGNFPSATPKESAAPLSSTTPKDTPAPTSSLFGQIPKPAPVSINAPKETGHASPQIKEEPNDRNASIGLKNIPEAPLAPDTVSKPRYVSGESSASSSNSRSTTKTIDDPLPPDWVPANKTAADRGPASPEQSPKSLPGEEEEQPLPPDPSATKQSPVPSGEHSDLPSEEDDDLSEFDGSGEDVEDDTSSPVEETVEDADEQLATSPESSFKSGERSTETSPTGGLFTKVNNASLKPRTLFGEVRTGAPVFPPPKPQESPRSPSPIRNTLPTDRLRFEASRSVSAPANPRSIIDQRKQAYAQSGLAAQAQEAQLLEIARQKQKQAEALQRKLAAESQELEELEDHDDERLREELQLPVKASDVLDDFVTYQARPSEEGAKTGVPAQIERLYRDINSMVDTLGINSRSLAAYIKHQQEQQRNTDWPQVLASETPADSLNDEWYLGDIMRLREGQTVLDTLVKQAQVIDVDAKLQHCQQLLSQDIIELKMKFASIRKTLISRARPEEASTAPLSAEQASLQHELRISSASVQGKLVQAEDALAVLRAKVLESTPGESGKRHSLYGANMPRKPTIEAVTNTVMKMTKMAEQKSADIDMLEAQLRKLDVKGGLLDSRHNTPNGSSSHRRSLVATSPGSSVYHTPGSKFGGSAKSTPARISVQSTMPVISVEDKEKWQAKAERKKAVAALFKHVLEARKSKSTMG